ncbi:peptidase P60 [Pseudohoeflea suaedae]|uniref:Peptidase P60 n=1 Tax=Pseudohoeflea suaedae TaxID=877384 RepID=A0A4R5PLV2_9HYPH|nr:NlpC/P60 family protein [Pseudohoeflea suaedae]TDH37932.1 peptidase P60 [Pseudohoeflea suaedae]
MSDKLDRRLYAYRPDLAEEALRGKVEAERFVSGDPAHVIEPVIDIRPRPDLSAGIDSQAVYGETLRVLDRHEGWAWIKCDADDYVGYVSDAALAPGPGKATHEVAVPRTFLYPGPDLKFPITAALSISSRLNIVGNAVTRDTRYLLLESGEAVIAGHCRPLDAERPADPVAVAALFLETPYLWGGRSGFGIDCSGLVQIGFAMTGYSAPRDSDMQADRLGSAIDPERDGLQRGDLVFWKGHVGFIEDDGKTLLHASGGTMTVTREPLAGAIARIAALYGHPTGYRRVLA